MVLSQERLGVLEKYSVCPVCESNDLHDRFPVDGFTITRCRTCEVSFVREIVPPQVLAQYYGESSGDQVYFDAQNDENLRFYDRRVRRWIESHVPKGRLLDVGCEHGRFLASMAGWEKHGIEIHPQLAAAARERVGDSIFSGTLEGYLGKKGYFDVVTMFDVLDHMPDPLGAVRKAGELLRDGGLLVVKVHDNSCLFARVSGRRFYALVPPYHLFYFDKPSLVRTLQRGGFQFFKARHFPHVLFLKTIFYRLSRGHATGIANRLYERLNLTRFGRIRIRKNLGDLITVLAVKR